MSTIVVVENGNKTEVKLSNDKELIIGRSASCDLVLEDPNISRQHCKIYYHTQEQAFVLSDLGAANGTVLNSNRISGEVFLNDSDKIFIQKVEIFFIEADSKETITSKIKVAAVVDSGIPSAIHIVKESEPVKASPLNYGEGDLIGDYKILNKIKDFKYGTVYATMKEGSSQKTALKIFNRNFSENSQAIDDFVANLSNASSLQHVGLVTNYDAGVHENRCYVTMEYVPFGDLNSFLQKHAPVQPTEAMRIIKSIAHSLRYAYNHDKTIHSNLNPAYVMFGENSNVIVTDNGLANWMTEYLSDGISTALPWYISPEQITGESEIDWTSDLYSLGIMLFQMLSGALPFNSMKEEETLAMHIEMELPSPNDLNPNVIIPKSIKNILGKMTAKKVEDRFKSWDGLIKAIEALSEDNMTAGPVKRIKGAKIKKFSVNRHVARKKLKFKVKGK